MRRQPSILLQGLRAARTVGLSLLEPVDYASRVINNKRRLPPLRLRREVGDLSIFESSGGEFMPYCKLLCNVQPNERVLDIGCGCGLMALFFEDYLDSTGRYVGVDVQPRLVRWCQKNISPRSPNFKFIHLDWANERYNPGGNRDKGSRVPEQDRAFDFILLKSVFTHLLPEDLETWVAEISRLLSDRGRCLGSFFLFTGTPAPANGSQGAPSFRFGDDTCRYQS